MHALQAILLISSSSAMKDKAAKEAAFRVLACAALQYKQLDHLLAVLTDMLNKDEHMSVVCAELAEYAAQHFGDHQLVSCPFAACKPAGAAYSSPLSPCSAHASICCFSLFQILTACAECFCSDAVMMPIVYLVACLKSIVS